MIIKIAFSVFLVAVSQQSFSGTLQEKSKIESDSVPLLKEVQVTATRNATDILSMPYSVNTISRKDLDEFQYRTTPEAMMGATGIFVQKTNHGGGSPFLRGLTGNQTLVVIDGIRFNNSTFRYGPNQYLNTIDAYTVSKIEVARGTGSVQYGSDALGGVVQLFTIDPAFNEKNVLHANVIGKATTNDMEYTGRGELQFQSEKFSVLAGYSHRKFGDLYGGDTTGKQSPSGYGEQAFDVKLKWKLSPNIVFTAANYYLQQKDVPLYHRIELEDFEYYLFAPQRRQMTYAKVEIEGENKWFSKVVYTASFQNSLEERDYHKNGNANKFIERDKVSTLGTSVDITSVIGPKWTANSGVEYYRDKVGSNKQQTAVDNGQTLDQRGLYPNDATSGNFSVYSLHHLSRGKFELEAGVRYNSFSLKIPDTTTSSLNKGNVVVKPSSLVGNAALLYHINNNGSVYTSFSTGYRAPNIDDMGTLGLVDFRYEVPAYDLKPEKTYNAEIGYRFLSRKVQLSAAFFYMHLSDLITRVQLAGQQVGGYNVYVKENSQKSYLYGTELSFDYRFGKSLLLKTNASFYYGQNTSANEPMRRIPPVNGRMLLAYNKQKWNVQLENLFASKQSRLAKGDQDDNRIPKGGTPAWNIFNLYGAYSFDKITIRLALQNLLNEDYRLHGSGINGMGRSASMGFNINL